MLRLDSGEHVDACLSIHSTQQNSFGLTLPHFALSPPQRLASRGSNSETALPTLVLGTNSESSAPLPLGSPFSHQTPWTAPGQCIALVNLPRPLPLRGYRRAAMPRTLQLISRPPMGFWSVGLALPYGSVSSLRRHGSFDLPHGALCCSQSRQYLPSLGLDDQRPRLRPVAAPRPLYTVCLQTPVVGQTPVPGHIPAAAASPRHDVRMARGVAVDGDRPIRLITMPRAPRMLLHRSLMPGKEQSLSLLLCPQAVPWTSTGTAVKKYHYPVDTILLFGITAPVNSNLFFRAGWPAPSQIQRNQRQEPRKAPLFSMDAFHTPSLKTVVGHIPPCLVVVGDGICHARTTARSSRRVAQPKPRPIGRPGSQIVGPPQQGTNIK